MKKNLLIIFMCISMVFMAVSCDDHIHTYSEDWTRDETHHWHAATCEHKDEKYGYAEHTFEVSKENAESEKLVKKCTVCGYVSKDEIKEAVLVSTIEDLTKAISVEGTGEVEEIATIYLANDIDLSETMKGTEGASVTSAGITIERSLTLDGNGYKIYNNNGLSNEYPLLQIGNADSTDSTKKDLSIIIRNISIINNGENTATKDNSARLINIWNIGTEENNNSFVTFENVKMSSEKSSVYLRGISTYGINTTVKLDNSSIELPHYYAIYIGSDCDNSKLVIKNNSKLEGWATIYNHSSNFTVEADNSRFVSNNPETNGGSTNSFSCVIVSEYYDKDEKSENNNMTFKNCIFEVEIDAEDADVTQQIADLRSPCNNTFTLTNCTYAPAKASQYFISCYNSDYSGAVDEKYIGTNKIIVNGENINLSDKVTWYFDTKTETGVDTVAFNIQYKNVEDVTMPSDTPYWYVRYYKNEEPVTDKNTAITLPTLTKDGKTFDGWYTEPTFENKIDSIKGTDAKHFTLYAKWE